MHKLQRTIEPACLGAYQHGVHQWSATSPSQMERILIWELLNLMQGRRCAYCENTLFANNCHIEHFRQRSRYPQGTFQWENLFGSCNRSDSCGKYKDCCGAYNHLHVIKPDVDDPDDFFVFVSDGTIVSHKNLSAADQQRANETLRIFNLDAKNGALRHMRRAAAAGYLQTAEEFQQFASEFDEADWRPLLQQELNTIADFPFATAIRHALVGI